MWAHLWHMDQSFVKNKEDTKMNDGKVKEAIWNELMGVMGFINDTTHPSPSIFSSFHWKPLPVHHNCFTQHFITIIKHMHGKKKINSKRQRSQNPGFERLIFIFLSCLLFFYVALFFSLREMERDMPFLPACASLWCFSGLLFCMGPAQSHAHA